MGFQAPEAGPRGSRPNHCRAPCPGKGSKNRVAGTPQEVLGHGLQRPGEVTGLRGGGAVPRGSRPHCPPSQPGHERPQVRLGLCWALAWPRGRPLATGSPRSGGRTAEPRDGREHTRPKGRRAAQWSGGGAKKPRMEGQHGQSRGRDARAGRRLGRGHLAGRRQASGLVVLLGS